MDNRVKISKEMFESGYNCAQSVFFAFTDEDKLSKDTALKISCGFGAGMGRMQEVCGAITGAIMVMGLKNGRGLNENNDLTSDIYKNVQEFMAAFKSVHGSVICKELLKGCDLRTDAGQNEFNKNGYFNKICIKCVETAARLLSE